MKLFHTRKCICKRCNSLDFFHCIIKSRNDRNTDDQLTFTGKCYFTGIFHHKVICPSGKFFVFCRIGMLDIHQIQIQIRKDRLDRLKWSTGHTFQRSIDSPFLCCPKHISGKFRLAEALTTRKSESSSGAAVVRTILFDYFDHLFYCNISTDHLVFAKDFHCLDSVFLRFRVAAPSASQHAAFQENNRTDSRAVMDRISLDVKNAAFCL